MTVTLCSLNEQTRQTGMDHSCGDDINSFPQAYPQTLGKSFRLRLWHSRRISVLTTRPETGMPILRPPRARPTLLRCSYARVCRTPPPRSNHSDGASWVAPACHVIHPGVGAPVIQVHAQIMIASPRAVSRDTPIQPHRRLAQAERAGTQAPFGDVADLGQLGDVVDGAITEQKTRRPADSLHRAVNSAVGRTRDNRMLHIDVIGQLAYRAH